MSKSTMITVIELVVLGAAFIAVVWAIWF